MSHSLPIHHLPTSKVIQRLWRASLVHFSQCLQAALIYRASLGIFLISEGISFTGYIAFWYMAARANPNQTIYTPLNLVLYFTLALFHHGIQHHGASRDVGSDIRLGKLSYAMIRPFPYLLQAVLRSMAFSVTYFFLLSPLLVLGLIFVPGLWSTFSGALTWDIGVYYTAALLLGLACGWVIRIVIGMIAFDMSQIWGPDIFFIALYFAGSGSVYPVDLLPTWILNLVQWTPVYYLVGFPVLTLMGRISGDIFWSQFYQGSLVLGITCLIAGMMWTRGIRRFEAIGI